MNTKDAKELLAAATAGTHCGDGKMIGADCAGCLTKAARHKLNEQAPATLAVAIKLAEAHQERPESEHDGGCSAGISKLPCKCSQKDRTEALAAWKVLFPEEEANV